MKKIILLLSLLFVAMFLVGCVEQEEISDAELNVEMEGLSEEELDQIIKEGDVQKEKALVGQAYRKKSKKVGRYLVSLEQAVKVAKIKKDKIDIFKEDEYPRKNLSIDGLNSLKTVFKENGTVTAGNSSGLNDGAAALVLMNREEAELRKIEPLVKIVSWATCGVEPSLMGLGPIPATNLALKKADWQINDVDLFEINEAFAAQSIAVIKDLKIPKEIVNVNGGAIALGHPIGASGARILVTLIHEMIKQNKSKGCATLCIGGGMGIAMCIERN